MDFGIDGFLDKFEKYWGSFATRVLVMLVALAVASFCIGTIWHWLVAPVLTFFQAPGRWRVLVQMLTWAIGTGAGVTIGWFSSYVLEKRRRRRSDGREALEYRRKAHEELSAALRDLAAHTGESRTEESNEASPGPSASPPS